MSCDTRLKASQLIRHCDKEPIDCRDTPAHFFWRACEQQGATNDHANIIHCAQHKEQKQREPEDIRESKDTGSQAKDCYSQQQSTASMFKGWQVGQTKNHA